MMQDADKGVRRSSSYDPKQATDAVAATSDQAIRQAYIAATLPKDRPSNVGDSVWITVTLVTRAWAV